MKTLYLIILLKLSYFTIAQTNDNKGYDRKGFIFGTAIGTSYVNLKTNGLPKQEEVSLSIPNFKFGYMLKDNFALAICLPGSLYKYKDSGRKRDRGFEGIIPSAQYWLSDKWWVLGGAGLCMDAPAFYDIKDSTERKFYFGPAIICGSGYEIFKKKNFALDLQSRIHYGYTNVPGGTKKGIAFSVSLGFNWY